MGCISSTNQEPEVVAISDEKKNTTTTMSLTDTSNGSDRKEKNSRRGTKSGVMTQIAMSFPKIRRSFTACQKVFARHAGDRGWVPKKEIKDILIELGANEDSLTDEEIEKILNKSNLDGDDKIDFKEFVIAAAVGCFLPNSQNTQQLFLQIRDGFVCVQDAFKKIDKDESGQIDKDELRSAFLSMRQDDLIEERLKELDFNGDNCIEFPEFIFGMCSWVGVDDEIEDNVNQDLETLSPQVNNTSFEDGMKKENENDNSNYDNNDSPGQE